MDLDTYIKMLLAIRKEHGNLKRIMIKRKNWRGDVEFVDYDPSLSEITQLVIQVTPSGKKIIDTLKPYDDTPHMRRKFQRILTNTNILKL
jgi:hypothetical protein